MAPRVRVLVVDDTDDLRAVIRMLLELDGRFEVVGEAGDGVDGVDQAGALQPDVVLLDRTMPKMSGLEALPRIREVAPHTSVVLYTSETDERVYQAAMASGAVDVMDKGRSIGDLAMHLSDALVRQWGSEESTLEVRVGPVPSDAALEWIRNTQAILRIVRAHPDLTEAPIDVDVLDRFDHYLETWEGIAERGPEFVWAARAEADQVNRLLDAWATIDRTPEERLAEHDLQWSAPRGREFFNALTTAVVAALEHHEATRALAERLQTQWG